MPLGQDEKLTEDNQIEEERQAKKQVKDDVGLRA